MDIMQFIVISRGTAPPRPRRRWTGGMDVSDVPTGGMDGRRIGLDGRTGR